MMRLISSPIKIVDLLRLVLLLSTFLSFGTDDANGMMRVASITSTKIGDFTFANFPKIRLCVADGKWVCSAFRRLIFVRSIHAF